MDNFILNGQIGHLPHNVTDMCSAFAGDAFLVATGSSQIKVYDRDGKERGVSLAGDMYIRDLRNTKGHISPCTHAQWHPTDRYTGMTSSEDGSIRVWDTWNVLQKTVIKPQLVKPGRIAVTACAYNHDGGLIGGGMFDGTLQIWDVKGQSAACQPYRLSVCLPDCLPACLSVCLSVYLSACPFMYMPHPISVASMHKQRTLLLRSGKFGTAASTGVVMPPKPQMIAKQDWRYVSGGGRVLRNAHEPSTEITSLAFASNGTSLATRGADETLKVLWAVQHKKHCSSLVDLLHHHQELPFMCSLLLPSS